MKFLNGTYFKPSVEKTHHKWNSPSSECARSQYNLHHREIRSIKLNEPNLLKRYSFGDHLT